jgi:RNA polymerase sigma factor (sigma-70 family)
LAPSRKLKDHEIAALSDEQILAYIRENRRLGRSPEAMVALQILVYRNLPLITDVVRRKVPAQHVEDAAATAMLAAIMAALRNPEIDNFRGWLIQIAKRRGIVDFFRKHENDPKFDPLAGEHDGDDDVWGEVLAVADDTDMAGTVQVIESVMAGLGDVHAAVVELHVFTGYSAKEAADMVNNRPGAGSGAAMTESNVNQIASRFRRELRKRLDESDTSP